MSGELSLDILLRTMTATLAEGTYVFATLPPRRCLPVSRRA